METAPLFDALGSMRSLVATEIFYSLCIAFVLALVLANVYRWTHQGFSYQRTFIQTVVLACITVCIMIMAIGNNMARGLGILGAMAFVRFRTPIRDPRDVTSVKRWDYAAINQYPQGPETAIGTRSSYLTSYFWDRNLYANLQSSFFKDRLPMAVSGPCGYWLMAA